jgi:hypothetical protein
MIARFGVRGAVVLCVLCLTAMCTNAIAQSALQSGVPAQFSLPAQNYVSNYYVDVDASAKQLTINLAGSAGADVDLFVRYGSPFPASPQQISEDTLNRYSHYHSFSSASTESVSVLPSSRVPLVAGRWYVAVINASGVASAATLTATTYNSAQSAGFNIDFSSASTDTTGGRPGVGKWRGKCAALVGSRCGQLRRQPGQRPARVAELPPTPAPITS